MFWTSKSSDKTVRQRTIAYLWLFVGMIALLVSSSFAWFSISATPRISEMGIYVNAPTGLQLALDYSDDNAWGQTVDFSELLDGQAALKPVSWSNEDECFKAVKIATDGRQTDKFKTLSDEQNANTGDDDQYYAYCTYFVRTDSACSVSLAAAREIGDGLGGSGTYVIGAAQAGDDGLGAEYAVRVGFRITPIDPITGAADGPGEFFIYEPNSDQHNDKTEQYIDTASIDGDDTLVDEDHLLIQTTSSWVEGSSSLDNPIIDYLGEFTTETGLFTLESSQMVRIDMYIWIEGQDLDCYGLAEDTKLSVNIQFAVDYSQQSGLETIPG